MWLGRRGAYQDSSPELPTKENKFNTARSHASLRNLLLASTLTAQKKARYSVVAGAGPSGVTMQPETAVAGSQKRSARHRFHTNHALGLRTPLRPPNPSHPRLNEWLAEWLGRELDDLSKRTRPWKHPELISGRRSVFAVEFRQQHRLYTAV